MWAPNNYNAARVARDTSAHPRYHFSGYAGGQIVGDGQFFDRSGMGNHGVRGADLSDANMFTNAGYVSTVDPTGGATDSALRFPNLNFDYAGGEKLLLWWLGKTTAEGAIASWMGDTASGSYNGVRIRCNTNGTLQPVLYNTVTHSGGFYGGSTNTAVADGTLKSYALFLDGENRKFAQWVNETLDTALATFNDGSSCDTTNANTWNLGTGNPAAAASTDGIVTQTRAFHMLRLSSTDTSPSVATLTSLLQQLRANPGSLVLGRAF